MRKRLFLAIPIPETWKKIFKQVKKEHQLKEIHWALPENWHLTLYFLGNVEEKLIPLLIEKLNSQLVAIKPFKLEFAQITFGPPRRQPYMIWATFNKDCQYQELVEVIGQALKESITVQPDRSELLPHVTLARFKKSKLGKVVSLQQPAIKKRTLDVSLCQLFESILTTSGPIYRVIATLHLG